MIDMIVDIFCCHVLSSWENSIYVHLSFADFCFSFWYWKCAYCFAFWTPVFMPDDFCFGNMKQFVAIKQLMWLDQSTTSYMMDIFSCHSSRTCSLEHPREYTPRDSWRSISNIINVWTVGLFQGHQVKWTGRVGDTLLWRECFTTVVFQAIAKQIIKLTSSIGKCIFT